MNTTKDMDEMAMIADLLAMQKQRMVTYCTLLCEASDSRIRVMLQDILIEASEDQYTLFQLCEARGFTQPLEAHAQELGSAVRYADSLRTKM